MLDIDYGNVLMCKTVPEILREQKEPIAHCCVCDCTIYDDDDYYFDGSGEIVCEFCLDREETAEE